MTKISQKKVKFNSDGYAIPNTNLIASPYLGYYEKVKHPIYTQDFCESREKGLARLKAEENGAPKLSVQIGFNILKPDNTPIIVDGNLVVFKEVKNKKDLAVDANGNLCLECNIGKDVSSFYVLLSPDGKVLELAHHKIEVASKNIYKVSLLTYDFAYYFIKTSPNPKRRHQTNNTNISTPTKRIGDFVLTNTEGIYDYSSSYNYSLKLPTAQKKTDTSTFYNGYAYGTVCQSKFERNPNKVIKATPLTKGIDGCFIDKSGISYNSFANLLKEDYLRRKNGDEPIIENLGLLIEDISNEIIAISREISRRFKDQDIGRESRQSMPIKERNLASKYDNVEKYLNQLLSIINKSIAVEIQNGNNEYNDYYMPSL